MPVVNVKGYGNVNFPNGMDVNDIRDSLRRRYSDQTNSDLLQSASKYAAPTGNVAAPYKPSLMERAGQGVADVLSDTGIISNRYGAQQIGKNVTAIGELLPGIGDVAAVDDFSRAAASGDNLGMGLAALGVIPVAGDLAGKAGNAFKANQGAANMDAMLDLLKPKGQAASIGFEKGAVKKDGIAKFTSPNGSTRYVMMDGGEPVSALQIMSRDGKDGVISNVFTLPSNQKKGLASKLMSKAKKDFKSIKHSDELTEQGARFANSVEGTSQAPVDVASSIKPALPMDLTSRVDRAKGQDFDLNKTLYHGTKSDIENFDLAKTQSRDAGYIGEGVYLTGNKNLANFYAKSAATTGDSGSNVMPVVTNVKNTKTFTLGDKSKFAWDIKKNPKMSKELTEKLVGEGFDSAQVVDGKGELVEMVVFDPKNIRSKFAKFDPENKGKASLLGGLGALGVGIGSRSRSDEEYE